MVGMIYLGGDKVKIDITDFAKQELAKIIETKKTDKSLRLYIAGYGWGGPSFGIALDEFKDGDEEVKIDNFNFLIGEDLASSYGKFTIDYSDNWLRRGFSIMPDRGGSGC